MKVINKAVHILMNLDEQYTGAAATTPAPEITVQSTPAKPAPFPSVMFVFMVLLVAWRFRRGTRA